MENVDRCYFCNILAQYNFSMQTPVCTKHWEQMYEILVPDYVDASQILTYKRLILEKQIWKA